nr:hypothetical protein [Salmonella enterica]
MSHPCVPRASGDKPAKTALENSINSHPCVPRASGDKPAETETGYEPSMCSPRQRG